jgi:hypothetical protein
MTAPGLRHERKHANHFSFTDAPFSFAAPGRWLQAQVMGGVHTIYPDVLGGPVKRTRNGTARLSIECTVTGNRSSSCRGWVSVTVHSSDDFDDFGGTLGSNHPVPAYPCPATGGRSVMLSLHGAPSLSMGGTGTIRIVQ